MNHNHHQPEQPTSGLMLFPHNNIKKNSRLSSTSNLAHCEFGDIQGGVVFELLVINSNCSTNIRIW